MHKINVEEQLNMLIKLQALDNQLYRLRKDRAAKPKLIEGLEARRNEEQAAVKEIEEKIKANQLKRKEKEMDLQSKEENVKKLSNQLYQMKTNKEYQTMQHEIEGNKADNSLLEDEILGFMDEADSLNKELTREKELFVDAEKHLNEDRKKIESEIAVIDSEIANFESQRKELTAQVDKRVLSHYEKVLANREGLALVAVRNHACQGCFMNLPPQVINEIRMKDKVVSCESCARILYIENDADV